ncbi:mucin-2 [Orycteropus afer afer]|uniref:Mucin-2 n=1 Tax=Orycteropus afer afer TaxID=1230840 RepID=A0AC54ZCV5_ORYAF|nr:mucin-2 [Orycteropus afer afer]
MGLSLAHLVAIFLALSLARGTELQREGRTRSHGHTVCSTWGDGHYKTFDGDVYQFRGLCDYNFASDCRDSYKEFAVHLRRSLGSSGRPELQYILLTIKDDTVYLTRQLVVVNGALVSTPHYSSGLLIEKNHAYTKVYSRAGLALMWNREDSLMLELDSKFRNHTCGLCGDFNGLQTYSEFLSDGILFSPTEFGNMQKINKPEMVCDDPEEEPVPANCAEHRAECERLLTAEAFADCQERVPLELYVRACVDDRCRCAQGLGAACVCSTVAEFSRQCSHAGGRPGSWRSAALCPKSCPRNMIYLESGSPCMDTCSHLEMSSLCEEHRMDGCFCPEGTVFDDVAGSGCIPVSQCHCKLHGHLYTPGQQVTNECEQCVCHSGRWVCKDLPCPGTCALEGGSHITTFDGKKFTFHGDCYYVLAKGDHHDSFALLGELAPCGSTEKQTCLKTVVLLADRKKNVVAFKSDGSVLLNELEVNLPHVTATFSIFRPSSYHIIVNTVFGLRLQLQLVPVMQLFATLDQSAQGQVQGLCGNFNGLASDDFKTAGGLVEATGAGFANTWKAQSSCHDKLDWLDDPCSLNIESANYAEHWCSLLKKSETPFSRCHSAVDPAEYYKRCKYDTCNCQNNEDCMCAALSSYARACAAKGVMLWGWRSHVCNKDVSSCPKSQTFLYNLTTCQQTCRSLSEPDKHCLAGFAPVDGCGCPDHTFMDEKGRCVPLAKCSCYHRGLYLEAGEVVLRQEERCVCRNGRLHCTQVKLIGQSCTAPKIHVDCNNLTAMAIWNPRPVSCQTLAAGYYQTECVSGCVCPNGLIDDGRGGCVAEENCPCVHNKDLYLPGDKIKVDCNTCTCHRGRWTCSQSVCHGTCAIYGSGHYITFDGKYYDFDGHCSYVAAQDYCGQNASLGSFSIITENVPCGTTGVTCSKAIKIFLGRTELKLEDRHRVVIQRDVGHPVSYTTREVGQYLVVEASTGIIIIWDKRTTIFIKLAPSYKGTVCGLCGNFDDRSNNDFTTRDRMVVESELDFGNSWKEAPTCTDVTSTPEPCSVNPHRRSWAEKQCSILKSRVFQVCHSKVDPKPFYEACVHDSCSCDTGGDCECFCSAVASYAQECTKEEACVYWRTPDLCPIFCDYYNPRDECEWHYEPCGNRSFETCRTINGIHSNISVSYLEGCYPRCPEDSPIYDEDLKKCVTGDKCGCYIGDNHYPPGASVPPKDICQSCICTNTSEVICRPNEGKIVSQTQHGAFCYWEICGPNGTIKQHFNVCVSTTPPTSTLTTSVTTPLSTTFPITTTMPTPTPSTVSPPSTTPKSCCFWSDWINEDHPSSGSDGGDQEMFDSVCKAPEDIECRSATEPHLSWEELGQKVQCDTSVGFVCKNEDQFENGPFGLCYDYEIRVNCCLPLPECIGSSVPTTTTPTATTSTIPSTTPTTSPVSTMTTSPTPGLTTSLTTITSTSTATPEQITTVTTTPTPESSTSVTTTSPTTTPCAACEWTGWIDSGKPDFSKPGGGDFEEIGSICGSGWAANIACRAAMYPNVPIEQLGQTVMCSLSVGLVCKNQDQRFGGPIPMNYCLNYEINVYCCEKCDHESSPTTATTIITTTTETPTPTISTPTETTMSTVSTTPGTSTPTPIISATTGTTTTPTPISTTPGTTTPTPISTTTGTTTTPTPISTTIGTSTPTPTPGTSTPTPISTTPGTTTPTPISTTTGTTTMPTPTSTSPGTTTPTPISTTPRTTTSTPISTTPRITTPTPSSTTTGTTTTPTPFSTTPGTTTPTPISTTPRTTTTTPSSTTMGTTTTPKPFSTTPGTTTPTPISTTPRTTTTPPSTMCKNQDQTLGGPIPMNYCLNYEISIYCCGKCGHEFSSTTATTIITTTTETPTPTISTPTETTTSAVSTTPGTSTPTPTISTTTGTTTMPTPISTTPGTTTPTPISTTTGTTTTPTPTSTTPGTTTPIPTISTTPGTSTPTPISTTPGTSTPTPISTTPGTTTPTSTISTTTGTMTIITSTISTTTETPTPTISTTTETTTSTVSTTPGTSTPTPTISTTPGTTTPTSTISTTTGTTTIITSTISTTTETPTPTISTTTETTTSTVSTTPGTSTPTPTISTTPGTTTPTPISTTTGTTTTPTPISTTPGTTTPTSTISTTTGTTTTPTPISTTPGTTTPTPTISTTPGTTTTPTPIRTTVPTPVSTTTEATTPTTTTTETSSPTSITSTTTPIPGLPTSIPLITPSISMVTGTSVSTSNLVLCCHLNDTYYSPGELVYNGTHGGFCYYVNCSLDCKLEIFNWSCPSTPSPTTTPSKPTPTSAPSIPSSPPTPSKLTPTSTPTTKPTGCPDFDPPRQENETFWLCNCTMAVCKHGNTVEIVKVECKPPPKPTCSNGLTPVRVMDPDGCCWHWECDSYNGLSFSIKLPYRLFGNNTKGQCGTCTNDTSDDCMRPSGEVISDCEVAADDWVVNDPSKPHCPNTIVTTKRPAVTHPGGTPCVSSPLCELIKDSLFAPCHAVAPPQHYYEACVFDSCFVPDGGLECASLQSYAALCAQEGICVDWRNHTHGTCSVTCPSHREYRACGPAEEPTCQSSPPEQNATRLVEGCFCPEGTMSYAPGFDICVELCGCVGPDNVPREFGEHFTLDCKDCVCLEGGSGIVCQPRKCSPKPITCEEDGTYPVLEVNPADTCCNITSCKCNTSLCLERPPVCSLGFEVKSQTVPERCCPVYSCVPKGVCVVGNAEYQPGSPVYSSKCQNCVCTDTVDKDTRLHVISCTHVPCNTTCNPGFELVEAPGECCRKCQQTHCIVNLPGNQRLILKPGDRKSDPRSNCTFFSCVKIHNQLISSVSNITCPDFDPSDCLPGTIKLMPNGCCKKCVSRNETRIPCSAIPVARNITHAGCTRQVLTSYCSGSCGTFSMYSAESQSLDHKCSCCKEARTSRREVRLTCPDGSSLLHSYTHIESCLCQDATCGLPLAQPGRARRSDPRARRRGRS